MDSPAQSTSSTTADASKKVEMEATLSFSKENLLEKVTSQAKTFEATLSRLSVFRKLIFFVGVLLSLSAFLGFFDAPLRFIGIVFCLFIGLGMMYFSFSEKNPLTDWMQQYSQKEKK